MVACFSTDERLLASFRTCVPRGQSAQVSSSWMAFRRASARARCAVVLVPRGGSKELLPRLLRLQDALPLLPLVLVAERDPDELRGLAAVGAPEVVWLHDFHRTVWPAVARARAAGTLRRFARTFDEQIHIPGRLRAALAGACRAASPVRTVNALADSVGYDRRSLWRCWTQTFGPEPPLRLQDFLHWLLLIHAAGRRAAGQSWVSVASDLGIHEHTIARLARSLAGMTLRELAAAGQAEMARLFSARVVTPLLDAAAPPIPIAPVAPASSHEHTSGEAARASLTLRRSESAPSGRAPAEPAVPERRQTVRN